MTNTTLIKTLSRIADQLERIGDILEAEIKNQDTKTDTEEKTDEAT